MLTVGALRARLAIAAEHGGLQDDDIVVIGTVPGEEDEVQLVAITTITTPPLHLAAAAEASMLYPGRSPQMFFVRPSTAMREVLATHAVTTDITP